MAQTGTTSTNSAPCRRLWTIKETGEALQVSTRTVRRLIGTGELRTARLGRCVRIVAASVDELILRGGER